jgi:hypothetical protein
MNYDAFETLGRELDENPLLRPSIPNNVYQPVKRCPNCQSVYLTDTKCEACGRSLLYHPIGEPFSAKSLYGFKERHYASFPIFVRYYPLFENKNNDRTKSYIRHLMKRFDDLLEAFGADDAISSTNRRFFYVEMLELIDELLRYGVNPFTLQQKMETLVTKTGPLLTQELIYYLNESKLENKLEANWKEQLLYQRVWGLRVSFWLKISVITTTIVIMAVSYYSLISSQVDK